MSMYEPMSDSEEEDGGRQLADVDDDEVGDKRHAANVPVRDQVADEKSIPDSLRGLRACKGCQLIKTFKQFVADGCENCNWHDEDVQGRTSAKFAGMLALMKPSESWIAAATFDAKARVSQVAGPAYRKPGVYALSLPVEEMEDLESDDDAHSYGDHYRVGGRAVTDEEDDDDAAYSDHE